MYSSKVGACGAEAREKAWLSLNEQLNAGEEMRTH